VEKVSLSRLLGALLIGLLLSVLVAIASAAYGSGVPPMVDSIVDHGYTSDRAIFIGVHNSTVQTSAVLIQVEMPLEEFLAFHDDVTLPSPNDLEELGVPKWSAAIQSSYGGWDIDGQMATSWIAVLDRAFGFPWRSFRSRLNLSSDKDSLVTPDIVVASGWLAVVDEDSWLGLPGVFPTRPIVLPLLCNWLIYSVAVGLCLESLAFWLRHKRTPRNDLLSVQKP